MKGHVFLLATIGQGVAHAKMLEGRMTQIPGQASQGLSCWQKLCLRFLMKFITSLWHCPPDPQFPHLDRSLLLMMLSTPCQSGCTAKKENRVNDDDAQCYICLVEYEEGERMRVLPCHHEFHLLCVDKWLKEVHRVCPLCRGNVCDTSLANHVGGAS